MDSLTATQREESHEDCPVMLLRRWLGQIFTLRRLCCVFGETKSVLFIISCWNRTKPSLGNGIERNRCVWAEHCAKNHLETLKWEVLPHPPYSPDIAPSDYYLFRSMAHGLAEQQFRSYEDIEKWLDSWIASKDDHFYRNGIPALPERWAKVVANDGQCFEWFIFKHFFTIKLHFHQENSGKLVAHLIKFFFYEKQYIDFPVV